MRQGFKNLRRRLAWIFTAILLPYSLFSTSSLIRLYLPLIPTQQQPDAIFPMPISTNSNVIERRSAKFSNATITELHHQARHSHHVVAVEQAAERNKPKFFRLRNNSNSSRSQPQPLYAIFYNIYINPRNVTRGVEIIKEQTDQIARKLSLKERFRHVPLYYNMIGYNYSSEFCPGNLTCIFLNYYEKAHEEVTLQSLYEYCRQNPMDEVYYLHNKGSFSTVEYNDHKRRKHTISLFHKGQKIMSRHNSCNLASMGWEPLPHWHNRGNFWLAKCSYVRNLIPPKDFDRARVDVFRRLLQQDQQQQQNERQPSSRQRQRDLTCLRSYFNESIDDIYQQSEEIQSNVGVGRYNNEVWIASHPDVVPCDGVATIFKGNIASKIAFRIPFAGHEWFRMHGRLYEFYHLYGKVPSNASFFWRYYESAQEPISPKLCRRKDWNRTSYYEVT